MKRITRRTFMKGSLAAGTAVAYQSKAFARVIGANDDVRLAVIGVGGQGSNHTRIIQGVPGTRLVAVCDADQAHVDRRVSDLKKKGINVKGYRDMRRLFDNKEIDAITTATPNHWHALVTVWACQAGKDVYVEKPVSHEVWEGRKEIEAARKYNRIVQTGTQKRSDPGLINAFKWIHEGHIGPIKWARGFCYKPRGSIGLVNGPVPHPESVDYNIWTGPAELEPLHRRRLHYDWHWVFNTGCGDIGNQGIHEMDLCRWALGQKKLAPRVWSFGGRFGYVDDANTPNTLVSYFDYKPAPLIFEVRGLPHKKGEKAMDNYRGTRIGVCIQCEGGYFVGGGGGGWIYDNSGKRMKRFEGDGGRYHMANFIKAVRSRKVSDLHADIYKGHISSALCHMGNISYRLGKKVSIDELAKFAQDSEQMTDSVKRFREHMAANAVDLTKTPVVLGPSLTFDPDTEVFTGQGQMSEYANMYVKRNYREPFIIPDRV